MQLNRTTFYVWIAQKLAILLWVCYLDNTISKFYCSVVS